MNRARHYFLACARLAAQQDRALDGRDSVDSVQNGLKPVTGSDQAVIDHGFLPRFNATMRHLACNHIPRSKRFALTRWLATPVTRSGYPFPSAAAAIQAIGPKTDTGS